MKITERLRNTPIGLIVLVGDMKIVVEKYRPYYTCEVCGTVDPSKRYEWANVTGDYADVEHGYRRMCCSCHRKFDKSKEGVKNNVKRKK